MSRRNKCGPRYRRIRIYEKADVSELLKDEDLAKIIVETRKEIEEYKKQEKIEDDMD